MDPSAGELRQMKYRNQPWRVVVLCVLLNRTRGVHAEPVARELFSRWPTPEFMMEANLGELRDVLRPLGMHKARANHLRLLSARWAICGEPSSREDLLMFSGVGPYAADAWEIVCRGKLDLTPGDKELLRYVEFARALAKDTA